MTPLIFHYSHKQILSSQTHIICWGKIAFLSCSKKTQKKTQSSVLVLICTSETHEQPHSSKCFCILTEQDKPSLLMKKPLLYPAGKQRKREKNKAEKMKEEDEILSGYMKPMMRTQIWGGVRLTHNYATTWQRQTEWYDLFILLIQALWCV